MGQVTTGDGAERLGRALSLLCGELHAGEARDAAGVFRRISYRTFSAEKVPDLFRPRFGNYPAQKPRVAERILSCMRACGAYARVHARSLYTGAV